MLYFILSIILIIIVVILISNIRIVSQANWYVIERLGTYYTTWGAGPHGSGSSCENSFY